MLNLIKAILFISPLAYMTGRTLPNFDLVLFHISFCVIFVVSQFQQKIAFNKNFVFLLLACLASVAMNGFQNISVFAAVNLFICFYVISVFACNDGDVSKIFLWVSIISVLISFLAMMGFHPIVDNPKGEPGAMFGNAPRLCYYLAITMPFVVKRFRITLPIYFLLGIFFKEIYLTIFASVLFSRNFRKYVSPRFFFPLIVLFFVIFIGVFHVQINQSLNIRWLVWEPTITKIFAHPMFGCGLDTFRYLSNQFINIPGSEADNAFSSFLQFMFSCGFIGVGAFLYTVKMYFQDVKFTTAAMSLIFLGLLSIFEYPFEVPKLWLTICFILAVYIKECNERSLQCK